MNNKETLECSNEYLCLKITSKEPCEQQHMVTYASSGVPVPQDKPQKMWGVQAAPGGSETHTPVIPPNAHPVFIAQPVVHVAGCSNQEIYTPQGWMKGLHEHPGEEKSARWYTAPTMWNFNEQKRNPVSLLRKQMSLFFSCFNILVAHHHFIPLPLL